MPVMDGYEATRRLRQERRYAGLPVIAMTAHALPGERERCAVAGMNGHIGKPIEPNQLYATLARYYDTPRQAAGADPLPDAVSLQLAPIAGLDREAGLRRAGGQPQLYRRLLAAFVKDFGGASATLAAQLADGDWQSAERLAHTLRGMAGTLGAGQVAQLAGQLEQDCRLRVADLSIGTLARLTPPLQALLAALAAQQEVAALEYVEPPDTDAAIDPGWLPRLQRMLAACDSEVLSLWQACRPELARRFGLPVARRIGGALEQFDFDQALAVLASATATQDPQP